MKGLLSKDSVRFLPFSFKQKQKYQGMFKIQKSGNKRSSGEIGLNFRIFASPKLGQDQVPEE